MAQALFPGAGAISIDRLQTDAGDYTRTNTSGPYLPGYSGSPAPNIKDIDSYDDGDLANLTLSAVADLFTGAAGPQASYHFDFHFRMWVIPTLLNLSNPTVDADIPFSIWNTFDETATLDAVNVLGSSVLSFDLTPGSTILDFQYREVNMRIADGEATVDATVVFDFDVGDGTLSVLAVVAETFPILPEVPVREQWSFRTDILKNYLGVEQRIRLLEEPRLGLDFDVKVVSYEERRVLYNLITSNIKVRSLVPLFQYAAPITQTTLTGASRFYFDPALTNLRVGKTMVVLNRATRQIQLGNVDTLYADGADMTSTSTADVEPGLWFVVPAVSCFIKDDSGLDFGTQAGTFKLTADAFEQWPLLRPGTTQTVRTFDGLPIIDKPFLITQPERFAYRREVLDGGVGARQARSRDTHYEVRRVFKFSVDRNSDEMDYWRVFFDTIHGAQKPFLASTQLPDLTLRDPNGNVTQGTSLLEINESYYETKLFPLEAFKRIKVEYSNGETTDHIVLTTTTDGSGNTDISISPSLTDDPAYTQISRISFLHRLRAADTVTLEHYNDYSYIKFGARTTNN